MGDSLRHRGPDDAGIEIDEDSRLFMTFRRLSILDLSSAGHQPMISASKRYVITFNGEIYNFGILRRELEAEGCSFRGHSDTEVLLAALERWGCERATERLRGMFAFALWDRRDRHLWLARDRMGIKPLYLLRRDGGLAYASEVRAFHACPLFDRKGDAAAARRYLQKLYVHGRESILGGVEKVPPGQVLKFQIGREGVREPARIPYWSMKSVAVEGGATPINSVAEATDGLNRLLRESVRLRLVADVPVGAFLSGGIDSSVVVAVMQEVSDAPVKTFTVEFEGGEFDEGPAAAAVADHLGTDHTSVPFGMSEVRNLVPMLPGLSDEPMANPSLLPTVLVSRVARNDVVVALSGDGGDELFAGYNRYVHGARFIRASQRIPALLRKPFASLIGALGRLPGAAGGLEMLRPASAGHQQPALDRLEKLIRVIRATDASMAYQGLLNVGMQDPLLPGSGEDARDASWCWDEDCDGRDLESQMMLTDQMTYLPDDLLTKVDRAGMWESLEVRVPILDQEIVRYSWRLPTRLKIASGIGKWPLRQLALRYLPRALIDRPKMGFTVPIADWLRSGIREWARDNSSPSAIRRVGLLREEAVAAMWKGFDGGRTDQAMALWAVAVLHAWSDTWAVRF